MIPAVVELSTPWIKIKRPRTPKTCKYLSKFSSNLTKSVTMWICFIELFLFSFGRYVQPQLNYCSLRMNCLIVERPKTLYYLYHGRSFLDIIFIIFYFLFIIFFTKDADTDGQLLFFMDGQLNHKMTWYYLCIHDQK